MDSAANAAMNAKMAANNAANRAMHGAMAANKAANREMFSAMQGAGESSGGGGLGSIGVPVAGAALGFMFPGSSLVYYGCMAATAYSFAGWFF
ncbi:unnamed protein product [Wickerhamomyces anomalus]